VELLNPLLRRLAKVESDWGNGQVLIVPQYVGMTRDEALQLRFGAEGAPPGADIVFIVNALPPDGVDYGWAEKRGRPEYEAAWSRLYLKGPCSP